MKKCICPKGKTDPKCPVCAKKDINLDSFHRLNPEAKPKTAMAKLDQFKLAYDPNQTYGQYGRDRQDDGSSGLNSALMLGAGGLGAAALHSGIMGARGKLLGGGFINNYQKGLGKDIRAGANKLRGHVGMDPVAQPPHPIAGHAQDAAEALRAMAGNAGGLIDKATPFVGAAAAAHAGHSHLMGAQHRGGQMYRDYVGNPLEGVVAKGKAMAGRAADWAAKQRAPKPPEYPAGERTLNSFNPGIKSEPGPNAFTMKHSMIYDAGVTAALATYTR